MAREEEGLAGARVLDMEDVEGVLSGRFYAPAPAAPVREKERAPAAEKPAHYKVICISMYTKDLAQLDSMVDELKARGLTKANRSALIRAALEQLDLSKVQKGM
jgi:hypothetical protein